MGFVMPHLFILIAGGAVGLALLFQIIGLATTGWVVMETLDIGLWQMCSPCHKIEEPDTYLKACRAFGILGVLAMAASLACTALICFRSEVKLFGLAAVGAAGAGAFCFMIEFAVFAGEESAVSSYFGYSFALTVVAFVLSGAAAVLFLLGHTKASAQ